MADFNEYSHKGETLMLQALKKLSEGDIDAFEKDRKEANRFFDLFYASVNSEEGKKSQLYGESRNFGIIYNVIEQNMGEDIVHDKKTRTIIKEVYNLIKNDKILNEQFKIYDFFEKPKQVDNVKDFVNETVSLIKNFDKKQVKESNEKLINFIRSKKMDEYVTIPENLETLYEAIEYIILNKKSFNNAVDYMKAQSTITEYVENRQKDIVNEADKDNKALFNEFNDKVESEQDKINKELNSDEKELLDTFISSKTSPEKLKKLFDNIKSKTIDELEKAMKNSDEEDLREWSKICEEIKSFEYSDNLSENITHCATMMELCSTLEN